MIVICLVRNTFGWLIINFDKHLLWHHSFTYLVIIRWIIKLIGHTHLVICWSAWCNGGQSQLTLSGWITLTSIMALNGPTCNDLTNPCQVNSSILWCVWEIMCGLIKPIIAITYQTRWSYLIILVGCMKFNGKYWIIHIISIFLKVLNI